SVSPRRSFTPTRGGSSAATGGGGLGSCSFFGGGTKGGLKTKTTVAKAKAGKRNAEAHRRPAQGASKKFRCVLTLEHVLDPCTVISIHGQRKSENILPKWMIFTSDN